VGFPLWNKALVASSSINQKLANAKIGSEGDTTIVYIPFDQDSIIDATLIVKIHDNDTAFKLLNDYDYKRFPFDTANTTSWNARDVFNIFAHFENTVFGRTVFKILDHRLVPQADSTRPVLAKMREDSNGLRTNRTSFFVISANCETWDYCYGSEDDFENECGSYCSTDCPLWVSSSEDCTYLFYTLGESAGGTSLFWTDENGNQVATDAGWEPAEFADNFLLGYSERGYQHLETWTVSLPDLAKAETFRTENIDTTGLDTCVRKVLDKLIMGNNPLGKLLGKMDRSILKTSNVEKFKIKFGVANFGGDTSGVTTSGTMNSGVWYDTIYLDQGVVDSATEIGVAQVIIHEAVHAYLKSILNRYANSSFNAAQIKAMSIDTLFNKYIDSMTAINTRNGLVQWIHADPQKQHNFMADHMISAFAESLKAVDNGRNSDEFYWLMGWVGLKLTRTINFYWPNYSDPTDWPPTNPAPSNDSTWNLKYALTQARLDSMRKFNSREFYSPSKAKGRPKQLGGCY